MRISTNQMFRANLDAVLRQQTEVFRTQTQVATGKRFSVPSEDPVAAKLAADLRLALDNNAQALRQGGAAERRLNLEEITIAGIENVLTRVREMTLQANNATVGAADRRALKAELDGLTDQLLGLANTKDGNGDYLFAGHRVDSKPFVSNAGQVSYQGDNGERSIELSDGVFVRAGDSGERVFERILDGNGTVAARADTTNTGTGIIGPVSNVVSWTSDTYVINFTSASTYTVTDSNGVVIATSAYSSGEDIAFAGVTVSIAGQPQTGDRFTVRPAQSQNAFAVLQSLGSALDTSVNDASDQAALTNSLNTALEDLALVEERFGQVRASIGGRLNLIEAERLAGEDSALALQTSLSRVQDIDLTEAVSNLNQRLTALDAAQRSLVAVQGLSLFNFLRG